MNRPLNSAAQFFNEIFNTLERLTEFPWEDFETNSVYDCPSFPPVDVIVNNKRDIVFKFALAGYGEDSIELEFEGDYMTLTLDPREGDQLSEDEHYLKRGIKKSHTKVKYYVPGGLYNQERAKAKFKKGLLVVNIPSYEKKRNKKVNILVDDE